MKIKYGIQVYEILDSGNLLNAIYTNNDLFNGKIYHIDNEIAYKVNPDSTGIEGKYNSRFHLTVAKFGVAYKFEWTTKDTLFEGIGLMTGNNHIAVSYVEVNQFESV